MVRASMALLASALLVAPAFVLFATLAKDATDISQPLSSTNVLGSKERPISKVVRMLKDMDEDLETSQDDDIAVHDEHVCLCDINRTEKTAAIERGETNEAQLQAFIGEQAYVKIPNMKNGRCFPASFGLASASLDVVKAQRACPRNEMGAPRCKCGSLDGPHSRLK